MNGPAAGNVGPIPEPSLLVAARLKYPHPARVPRADESSAQ